MSAPESPGATKYGASMGRGGDRLSDLRGRVSVRRVRLDRAGYDKGGGYWGIGEPLWYAVGAEAGEVYFRAQTRKRARAMALDSPTASILAFCGNALADALTSERNGHAKPASRETFVALPNEKKAAVRLERMGLVTIRRTKEKTGGYFDWWVQFTPFGLEIHGKRYQLQKDR